MDERGTSQVFRSSFVPGGGGQHDVAVQGGGGHAEIQHHQQIQLARAAGAHGDFAGVDAAFFVADHRVLRAQHVQFQEVLMALASCPEYSSARQTDCAGSFCGLSGRPRPCPTGRFSVARRRGDRASPAASAWRVRSSGLALSCGRTSGRRARPRRLVNQRHIGDLAVGGRGRGFHYGRFSRRHWPAWCRRSWCRSSAGRRIQLVARRAVLSWFWLVFPGHTGTSRRRTDQIPQTQIDDAAIGHVHVIPVVQRRATITIERPWVLAGVLANRRATWMTISGFTPVRFCCQAGCRASSTGQL